MFYLTYALIVLGCVAIGGYLALQGHPWLGLFAMLVGGSVSMRRKSDGEDDGA